MYTLTKEAAEKELENRLIRAKQAHTAAVKKAENTLKATKLQAIQLRSRKMMIRAEQEHEAALERAVEKLKATTLQSHQRRALVRIKL